MATSALSFRQRPLAQCSRESGLIALGAKDTHAGFAAQPADVSVTSDALYVTFRNSNESAPSWACLARIKHHCEAALVQSHVTELTHLDYTTSIGLAAIGPTLHVMRFHIAALRNHRLHGGVNLLKAQQVASGTGDNGPGQKRGQPGTKHHED